MESYAEPFIYSKEETQDFRGSLEYYNSLDLDKYKRLYIVKNPKIGTVRAWHGHKICLLYTSPSPRDKCGSRMPSSA